MKKLLILSYHFPPMNAIASRRAEAYALFLKQYGIEPTVVTHDWHNGISAGDLKEAITETYENYSVIRIPHRKSFIGKAQDLLQPSPHLLNMFNLIFWALGYLETRTADSYFNYRRFLNRHLRTHSYDMVLAVYSPEHHVRMAHHIFKKFGIRYAVDYRDLWDNGELMTTKYNPSKGRKFLNYFSRYYHKKWLRNASFITAVSQPLVDYLKSLTGNASGYRITNGFESGLFTTLLKNDGGQFLILYGGTIYSDQNLTPFIEGLRLFWNTLSTEERQRISIVMLGIRNDQKRTQLVTSLPEVPFTFTDRVSRQEALQMMKNASILYFAAYPTHRGIYSGKIFEYLGSGNNILVTPTDNDVVEELMQHTGAGIATSDPKEVAAYLKDNFAHWQQYGVAQYKGNTSIIAEYTREYQVGLMAAYMHKVLEERGSSSGYTKTGN